jgi:hypothetical protein
MRMTIEAKGIGRDLAELNEGFLELVAQGPDAGLPSHVVARLRLLDAVTRRRLASAPFALFTFGFEDEAAWAVLLSPGVRDLEPAYLSCEPAVERFVLLALTVLRGLLRTTPHSISAWIGLTAQMRSRLAALEVGGLGQLAVRAAPRLRGRLAGRETFWLRIIAAAEGNDLRQLALLTALGKQWAIRRSLGLSVQSRPVRGFRR